MSSLSLQVVTWAEGWHAINMLKGRAAEVVLLYCPLLEGNSESVDLFSCVWAWTSHPASIVIGRSSILYTGDYLGSLHFCILILLREIMFHEKGIDFRRSVNLCPRLLRGRINR